MVQKSTRPRKESGDSEIAPKLSDSMEQLSKAATKIGKSLDADVVVVQKSNKFAFKNPFPSSYPKVIRQSLRRAKSAVANLNSSVANMKSSVVDWTSQTLNPQKIQKYIKDVNVEKYSAAMAAQVVYVLVFVSSFLLTYYAASMIQQNVNPESKLEELHRYLTGTPANRTPRLPEAVATLVALFITPKIIKSVR